MPSESSQRRHPAQAGESRQMEKPEARKFASRWVGVKTARAMQMPSGFLLRRSSGSGSRCSGRKRKSQPDLRATQRLLQCTGAWKTGQAYIGTVASSCPLGPPVAAHKNLHAKTSRANFELFTVNCKLSPWL